MSEGAVSDFESVQHTYKKFKVDMNIKELYHILMKLNYIIHTQKQTGKVLFIYCHSYALDRKLITLIIKKFERPLPLSFSGRTGTSFC